MNKKLHSDVYLGIICLVFTLFFLVKTISLPSGPNIFPYLTLGFSAICEIVIIIQGIHKTREIEKGKESPEEKEKMPVKFWLCMLLYFILFYLCGYFIANIVFMPLAMRELGIKDRKTIIIVTVLYTVLIYLIFVVGFGVPLQKFGRIDKLVKKWF